MDSDPENKHLDDKDAIERNFLDDKHAFVDPDATALDILALPADVEETAAVAEAMSPEELQECLLHIIDTNFPARALMLIRQYLYDDAIKTDATAYRQIYEEVKIEAAMITINSPYAEVRAVVDNHDDPMLPSMTFRAGLIGLVYVVIGAFINQFFSIRQPGISVEANVAQLLAYPAGKLFERVLPTNKFRTFGYEWTMNPGKFNMKEHMVITIIANVGFNLPYTTGIIWVQSIERFFNLPWAKNFGYQILISLSTNFIGYGLAGITRRFLVYPSYAIWPSNLATIALNRAFHSERNAVANGWRITRMTFFLYAFGGMFVYFSLSYFNWITWFSPKNALLAGITGGITGLGLNPISTFDYNVLTVGGDPLINPFFTMANYIAGALITMPVIAALWVNNVWYTGYLPINSNGVFDNTGARYNVSMAVNAEALFDAEAYRAYSPAYLSASMILLYGFFFATYAATISHTAFVLVFSIALGAAGVGAYPTSTTPAVVLYGILLALVFCVPVGIIRSITNAEITLNVLAEFFGGLWFPGNANALNFFKSYGFVTTSQTLNFAQDLKLAHYTHIPPRVTFWAQLVATFVSTFVCVGVLNFQLTQIPNVCAPEQQDRFTCPGENTFFTASVLWGTLGPSRMFGRGAIYSPLLWCFLIGLALPVIVFCFRDRMKILKYFHLPVFLLGSLIWAPYNLTNIWPAIPIAYIFNVFIKKRYLGWWSKYNYVLASAFTCAIAISAIIQFFAVQWYDVNISWPGNNKPFEGCDNDACPYLVLGDGEHFGPIRAEIEVELDEI
ncbi:OPT-domain-containing protein [Desarmillaria tabescens]|uniref:OPT-domain-containing protein n=1 Tax=Armillaria tabescens TaxID=1929756 RepID=A0AA39K9Y5_ARMTA|nr:OPT-domain-containing protein [Desarmillaria tabescens]KAK0457210.1 OPT-domain-containing protein [Desarmillaria tabescens]